MVNYYFDTFEHLKSFDVVPYQDIIDLYLTNQSLLDKIKIIISKFFSRMKIKCAFTFKY